MLKVLVVDDMDIMRLEIKRLKIWGEKTGFMIAAEASNGQAALEVLESSEIDLVITDIKMPKVDGLELLKKIVTKKLCPCVVLLSDYAEFTYARQGIVLGAFDYMSKPVSEDELIKLLERAKAFILEKNKEQERVKNLEQNLKEQVEVFFPRTDTNQIIELIGEGDIKCLEVAIRMVEVTAANVGDNLLKMESILKNVLFEVAETLFENKKWLMQFIDFEQFKNVSFIQCQDIHDVREVFVGKIEKICRLINMLQCGRTGNDIVCQICECALENIYEDLSLKAISEKLFMNKTYLSESFKQKTGISLVEYLTKVKIEKAKKLLIEGNLKTYEIGSRLGYKDIEYFSKLFKKYTGITPTKFRENNTV